MASLVPDAVPADLAREVDSTVAPRSAVVVDFADRFRRAAHETSLPADLPRARTSRRVIVAALALLFDVLALLAAYSLAVLIHGSSLTDTDHLVMMMVVVSAFAAFGINSGAYAAEALFRPKLGTSRAAAALGLGVLTVLVLGFMLKASADYSRLVFAIGTGLAFFTLILSRGALRLAARRLLGGTPYSVTVLVDGVDIDIAPDAYRLDAARHGLVPDIGDPVMMDRLGCCLKAGDRFVIACTMERRRDWALVLKGMDADAEIIVPELDAIGSLAVNKLGGVTTVQVAAASLNGMERTMKRALDLAVTIAAMPFLIPVFAVIAIAIKLDSRGPVLFVQDRIGQGNRLFRMYKFRSMRVQQLDAMGVRSTARDDDRITRVGAFIRKTSLDELPQLLNVLGGSMSLVGPRPHAVASTAEDEYFWTIDNRYWDRHAMKPGVTGLAQIRGFRGATEQRSDLTNRLQADLEYLVGWSVWRDIAIMFMTLRVLVHRNAF